MNFLGFDPKLGQVRIVGCPELFPPRALIAGRAGDMITVARVATGANLIAAPYTAIGTLDGTPFTDAASCLAYVAWALAERPPGDPIQTLMAASDLGGHRLICSRSDGGVGYASCDDPASALTVLGLTLGAAGAGSPIDVLTGGSVEELSWSFTPGPAFLGLAGAPTQAAPTAGVRLPVGTFVTPTRLIVAVGTPILLAP